MRLGFTIVATRGTAAAIRAAGLDCEVVNKVKEGRPHIVDRLVNGEIAMVVNTTIGAEAIKDSFSIRRTTLLRGVPYFTTVRGAHPLITAMPSSMLADVPTSTTARV